jgi:hypothetical protein
LWSDGRDFTPAKECAADLGQSRTPSSSCQDFLKKSEKADLQWKLESQFFSFESQTWPPAETVHSQPIH